MIRHEVAAGDALNAVAEHVTARNGVLPGTNGRRHAQGIALATRRRENEALGHVVPAEVGAQVGVGAPAAAGKNHGLGVDLEHTVGRLGIHAAYLARLIGEERTGTRAARRLHAQAGKRGKHGLDGAGVARTDAADPHECRGGLAQAAAVENRSLLNLAASIDKPRRVVGAVLKDVSPKTTVHRVVVQLDFAANNLVGRDLHARSLRAGNLLGRPKREDAIRIAAVSAGPVLGLQKRDSLALLGRLDGGGNTGDAGTHDANVNFLGVGHLVSILLGTISGAQVVRIEGALRGLFSRTGHRRKARSRNGESCARSGGGHKLTASRTSSDAMHFQPPTTAITARLPQGDFWARSWQIMGKPRPRHIHPKDGLASHQVHALFFSPLPP